ncbi:fibronectin type III domain-containing protein [Hymenobacter glacieicola]|uniref:Fibronectin type-III domain-containing protein n=1 Tax=Hymenobacter glacieicola TaxID=1562124 RepID=A0ABQ1X2R6_9BACT|nr:fibronectin type III domain-containing protein [Hymenobacter glacieicola]GGG55016.1 hypothetical protein GCM10011378_33970 [Hymenobacter glacieicola]
MKTRFLSCLFLSSAFLAQAQQSSRPRAGQGPSRQVRNSAPATPPAPTIAAARQAGPGSTVTVRGVVENGPELGQLRFIQDRTHGLALFSTTNAELQALMPGDSVLATGTLKNYNGLLEMDPVTSVQKLASNRRVVATEVAATDVATAFEEGYEGRLLRITGITSLTTSASTPAEALKGNTNYLINGQRSTPIRVHVASTGPTGMVDKTPPPGPFDLLGILSQFSPSGTGGYQLLPRQYADFSVAGGLPAIQGEPVPTAIHRNGFTVTFQTINPGTTTVEYGKTTALGTTVNLPATTTVHSVELTNLEPGTVYYVRVSSTNAAGTSRSAAVPMITDTKKRLTSRP